MEFIMKGAETLYFSKNEKIKSTSKRSEGIYFVLKGKCTITDNRENEFVVPQNNCFGEIQYLLGKKQIFKAVASQKNTIVGLLHQKYLNTLTTSHPILTGK